jgi:hypothetical protein
MGASASMTVTRGSAIRGARAARSASACGECSSSAFRPHVPVGQAWRGVGGALPFDQRGEQAVEGQLARQAPPCASADRRAPATTVHRCPVGRAPAPHPDLRSGRSRSWRAWVLRNCRGRTSAAAPGRGAGLDGDQFEILLGAQRQEPVPRAHRRVLSTGGKRQAERGLDLCRAVSSAVVETAIWSSVSMGVLSSSRDARGLPRWRSGGKGPAMVVRGLAGAGRTGSQGA